MTEKRCFVVSPIGEDQSEERKRADQVLNHIVKPAAHAFGYSVQRADEIDEPGIITTQVIQRVTEDDLVVADLTGNNPNVFYELAIRHAISKPYIQVIQKGHRMPFDVANVRTVHIDHQDLDTAAEAKNEIEKQISSIESNPTNVETPFSVAIDMQQLRQSGDPQKQAYADLINEIAEIKSYLANFAVSSGDEYEARFRKLEQQIMDAMKGMEQESARSLREDVLDIAADDRQSAIVRLGALSTLIEDFVPWAKTIMHEAMRLKLSESNEQAQFILREMERELTNGGEKYRSADSPAKVAVIVRLIRRVHDSLENPF